MTPTEDIAAELTALTGTPISITAGIIGPVNNLAVVYCDLIEGTASDGTRWYARNSLWERQAVLATQGVQLVVIYSSEWQQRRQQCVNVLRSTLGISTRRLQARKCSVKAISGELAREFVNTHHLQSLSTSPPFSWGLFFSDELVAVLTAGPHHRSGYGGTLILQRLCFKDDVYVIGGAARLFSAMRAVAVTDGFASIRSWSDSRWFEGHVYEQLGFTQEAELQPDYSYVTPAGEILSKQSQAKKPSHCPKGMTELDWATQRGLRRIWDCGKKTWTLSLKQTYAVVPKEGVSENCFIYALKDPRFDTRRYVGQTSRGLNRPKEHTHPRKLIDDASLHSSRWLAELTGKGFKPVIEVLEYVPEAELDAAEVKWIAEGRRLGWPLTNMTDGGAGSRDFTPTEHAVEVARIQGYTPEVQARLSEIHARNVGIPRSAETKEKIRLAKTGVSLSPEHRAAISAGNLGREILPETRKKIGAANAARPHAPLSEEHRAKLSAALKGKPKSPEAIEKMRQAKLGTTRSEETKEKVRQAKLGKPLSEAHKAALKAGQMRRRAREALLSSS